MCRSARLQDLHLPCRWQQYTAPVAHTTAHPQHCRKSHPECEVRPPPCALKERVAGARLSMALIHVRRCLADGRLVLPAAPCLRPLHQAALLQEAG